MVYMSKTLTQRQAVTEYIRTGSAPEEIRLAVGLQSTDINGVSTTAALYEGLDLEAVQHNSLKNLVRVVPIKAREVNGGTYAATDDTNISELPELAEITDIIEGTVKFLGGSWALRTFGDIISISRSLAQDTTLDLTQVALESFKLKAKKTENKRIIESILLDSTPETVIPSTIEDKINDGMNVEYDHENVIITNKNGLKKLKTLSSYKVENATDGTRKRYIDIYPVQVLSEDELPEVNAGSPLIFGTLKHNIVFFEDESLEFKVAEQEFQRNRKDVRIIERFDVRNFGTNKLYNYVILT